MNSLCPVGTCDERIFGLAPMERLARQTTQLDGVVLVASASAVLGDGAISWLSNNPGTMLTSSGGKPLGLIVAKADCAEAEQAFRGDQQASNSVRSTDGPTLFNRKLRRREKLFAMSLDEHRPSEVETALFDSVYKGVTDLVTKWVWPKPAFWVTRTLAALRISPNAVTLVGILLVFVAAYLFYRGQWGLGLAAAWLMTFLDTVDGKLARVTATSSKLGDRLDHRTDIIHPPLWWLCVAAGLQKQPFEAGDAVWPACAAILVVYLVSRLLEGGFKAKWGFNPFIWRPFDSAFRLVVARRNTILLILTGGLVLGDMQGAFIVAAGWSVLSVVIQFARFWQARSAASVQPWLAS